MKTETEHESWRIRRRIRFRGSSDIMLESYQVTYSYCDCWNHPVAGVLTKKSTNQMIDSVKKEQSDFGITRPYLI